MSPAGVAHYFGAYSSIAGDKLNNYYRVISMLSYHGELDILYKGLRQAVPFVKESGDLVAWAYAEFGDKLADSESVYLHNQNPELTAADPTLQQHFAEVELIRHSERMNLMLAYRSGRLIPAWTGSDFDFIPGADDDHAKKKSL